MDTIELNIQDSHTVTLKSLATAGYQWTALVDNLQLVRVERVIVDRAAGVSPPRGSLDEQFTLTALAAGETIVHFLQARPFERAKPAHATYEVNIRVAPA